MKIAVMKLMCLAVVAAGIVVIGWSVHCSYIRKEVKAFRAAPPATQMALAGAGGLVATVVALYGLLPSPSARRRIRRRNEHGETVIQLAPMVNTLTRVIASIPEVKRVRVQLIPTKDKEKVKVKADVVLRYQAGQPAKSVHDLINQYLKETAAVTLGLEVIDPIQLTVTGVDVDPKAVSKALRDQLAWADMPQNVRIQVPKDEEIDMSSPDNPPVETLGMAADPALTPMPEAVSGEPLAPLESPLPAFSSQSDFDVVSSKDEPVFDTLAEPLDAAPEKNGEDDDDKDNNRWSLQP